MASNNPESDNCESSEPITPSHRKSPTLSHTAPATKSPAAATRSLPRRDYISRVPIELPVEILYHLTLLQS
jgi:hypothetical protein